MPQLKDPAPQRAQADEHAPAGAASPTSGPVATPARLRRGRLRGVGTSSALRTAVVYTILGVSWIFGSDHLVRVVSSGASETLAISVIKGVMFVLLSALAGFILLRRAAGREQAAEEQRARSLAGEREAAARAAELLESIGEGFFALDREGRFVHVNRRAESLLRRSSAELLGRDIREVYTGEASTPLLQAYREALETDAPTQMEGFYAPLEVWLAVRFYPSATGMSVFFSDVSERRRVEQELQHTAGLLDTLLEQAPVGFAFFDRDLRYVRVNQRHTTIIGEAPETLIGRRITEAFPLVPGVETYLAEVLATGKVITRTDRVPLPHRSGPSVALWVSYYPVRAQDGSIVGVGVVVDDVTRERETEERLERTVALLSATLDSTLDAVLVEDLERRILVHNRSFREMWGLSEAVVAGDNMVDLRRHVLPLLRDPESFVAFSERLIQQADASGEDVVELTDRRIIERRSVPHRVGGLVAGRVWSYRDVTEQRQADAELRESASRFRLMVEGSEEVFFYRHDVDGIFQYLSPSVRAVLGYEPEELLGRQYTSLISDDASLQDVKRRTARAIETGAPVAPYSANNRRRDGRLVTLEVTEVPVVAGGVVVGMQGFGRDVTERRRLESELRQAQKMEAVGRLAGGVAHDFNNILTVVTGCAHVALEQTRDPDVARLLGEIGLAAERAAGLTRQLLAFSRKQVVKPRVVDLNALLLGTDSMLRRVIGEDVALEVVPSPESVATWADPGQVEQVLLNLAVNARDAMPTGGTLRISISRRHVASPPEGIRAGAFALLEVADNGVGIPEDVLPRIFEPFFTTKEFGAGTGLGLATVYGIVQQTGGWVEVESISGSGSSFRAYFPAHAGEAPGFDPALEADQVPGGTERILVVEDEVAVRSLVRRVLERLGYQVLEAADGREGLRVLAAQRVPFDLILSDVVMPGMSGPEFLEQCRHLSPDCRLALMSGYAADRLPAPVGGRRAFPFIEKPFEPARLGRVVRELLDGDTSHSLKGPTP